MNTVAQMPKASTVSSELRAAYEKVDGYQPVYKLEAEFNDRPNSRGCLDRCEVLARSFGDDTRNIRILDIGCSMGYLSLYFADRGAEVTGIDINPRNVAFCSLLGKTLGIPAGSDTGRSAVFKTAAITEAFTRQLPYGSFDAVFLFSVLHHVVSELGIPATQRIVAELLEKSDALYVELAHKGENVDFAWRGKLPDNDLDIFAAIPGVIVEKLGDFPALGGVTVRPLYKVTKKDRTFCRLRHNNVKVERSDLKDGRTRDRKYYLASDVFTKAFVIGRTPGAYHKYLCELTALRSVGNHPNFSPVVGTEVRGKLALITVPRLPAKSLMAAFQAGEKLNIRRMALDIVAIIRALAANGFYWNDCRSHNLMLNEGRLIAIDFEGTSPVELENTLHILLWLLVDLQSGRSETHGSGALERAIKNGGLLNLERPARSLEEYHEDVRDIAKAALESTSISEFLSKYPVSE